MGVLRRRVFSGGVNRLTRPHGTLSTQSRHGPTLGDHWHSAPGIRHMMSGCGNGAEGSAPQTHRPRANNKYRILRGHNPQRRIARFPRGRRPSPWAQDTLVLQDVCTAGGGRLRVFRHAAPAPAPVQTRCNMTLGRERSPSLASLHSWRSFYLSTSRRPELRRAGYWAWRTEVLCRSHSSPRTDSETGTVSRPVARDSDSGPETTDRIIPVPNLARIPACARSTRIMMTRRAPTRRRCIPYPKRCALSHGAESRSGARRRRTDAVNRGRGAKSGRPNK